MDQKPALPYRTSAWIPLTIVFLLLFALPVRAQKTFTPSFEIQLSDSLTKAVRLYVKEQEKRFGLSEKKHVLGIMLRPGLVPECYISATGKRSNVREFPSMYLSRVDGYWIRTFVLDVKLESYFEYPESYLKFTEESLLPLLEKESTALPREPFQQWKVVLPPGKPIDIKITL